MKPREFRILTLTGDCCTVLRAADERGDIDPQLAERLRDLIAKDRPKGPKLPEIELNAEELQALDLTANRMMTDGSFLRILAYTFADRLDALRRGKPDRIETPEPLKPQTKPKSLFGDDDE